MQKIAALSNLVAYYCIALPVGAALMFKANLKILGKYFVILLYSSAFLSQSKKVMGLIPVWDLWILA